LTTNCFNREFSRSELW